MAQQFSSLNVLWVIDPFESLGAPHRHASQAIQRFVQKVGAQVTPVSVQSLAVDVVTEMPARWKARFLAVYEDAIRVRLKELKVHGIHRPVILSSESVMIPERAEALVRYSESVNADLIVVTTRKKLGLKELFGDSFAETLFYCSKLPVLVFGSSHRSVRNFGHILFPTDFSAKSHSLFRGLLRVAKQLRARLTLLHAVDTRQEILPNHQSRDSADVDTSYAQAQALARRWTREAGRNGVQADAQVLKTRNEVAHEILKLARRKGISLIAMQDKSSPLSTNVIGSNTRQVVRNAPCPVLVLKTGKRAFLRARHSKAA